MPAISASQPIARPCAAAIPTRMPVKLPGPTPTRMCVGAAAVEQLVDHRHQPLGVAAADDLVARARCTARRRRTGGGAGAVDVSIARIIGLDSGPQAAARQATACVASDRFDRLDLGHIVADQALDPALQRDRRRRAARAGALHAEIERAVLVAAIDDVAAVLRDRRADAGFDQILDLVDDLGVGRVLLEIGVVGDLDPGRACRARTAARR